MNKAEESQGKALIDESIRQKVKFFVYSSVDRGGEDRSFNNPTNIPHFMTKHNITASSCGSHQGWQHGLGDPPSDSLLREPYPRLPRQGFCDVL
jgi:hypothetical protein